MPGETSKGQSNFNKQEVSLYAHLYEKYVEIKNVDGTDEITPDKYNCHNGGVVLEYVDCRSQPTCTGKRIFLRQNTTSVWDDVLRMCQDAGGTWTQEMAIQVESQLLLAMHPIIDLDPNSTLQGMKRYDPTDGPVEPVHRELKTRKRKLNSYELEQEAVKKAKKEQMMFMMDERHGREFKPTFKLLPYFKSNRNKISTVGKGKQRADADIEQGRGLSTSAKKLGRKFVRQLIFERSVTDDDRVYKLFTLLNIYQEANGKHEAIFYSLNEKDLRAECKYNSFIQTMNDGKEYKLDDSQATLRNELGNDEAYKAFIKSFVVLYSIDNNLKYDSERVDIVPVDMLPKVTTELTSPQTEMKFDSMQPYKIIELLPQQSDVSSNEGIKDLSVSDLYNAAAKKAMQAKPSVSTPINQDPSLMSPPRRRNSQRSKQTVTTQAQVPIPVQNAANPLVLMRPGNQTSVQQQVPQVQMHQPQVMTASQSPNQRPVQSPALIHTNFPPVQVPQSSTDGTRPIQQIPIPTIVRQVPIQIPNAQMPMQQVQLMQGQMVGQSNNVQVIQNITQGIPNIRPIGVRINNIPNLTHATQVNARSTVNQSVAQGATITSPSIHKIVPARRSTQGQSQQMNTPAQQTGQMNISPQMNSSPMNQIQVSPQINIPTQPTDPRVTPQLNVQSQMNQVQPAVQMNIPTQVSDQVNIQQTQTTPRINPGRVTPQINAQAQMNQARSTPQINIPTQVSDQMQATLRMNPRMNVQLQSTDQNTSAQRINRPPFNNIQQQQQFIAAMRYRNGFRNPGLINMQNMQQQPFMQFGQNMMLHSQLLPGQQQGGIRPQMRPQIMRVQPQQVQQVQQVLIRQNIPIIQQQQMAQQLGVQMNGGQWVFPQNQIQPPQQPPNPQNPWNGNGNSGSKQ